MSVPLLLLIAAGGVALLLALVIVLRWHAFVALLAVAVAVGLAAGMPPAKLLDSLKAGMAETLGFIAVVVGLGAILGQIVESAGGAERLARTLVARYGERHAGWALGATGLIVAIPVFFDVALVILAPLAIGLARRAGRPVMFYALPLLAGLAVGHAFIPPTPGPLAVAQILGADMGWVICMSLLCGIPAMICGGPAIAGIVSRGMPADAPAADPADGPQAQLPSFWLVLGLICLPLLLIVGNTVSAASLPQGHVLRGVGGFVGHPFIALLISVLAAWYAFPALRAGGRDRLLRIADKALEPAGIVILVTGAGGVFKQVLIDSGVGKALAAALAGTHLPTMLLAFIIAALIRLAQGSATVAMITAAGIVAPLAKEGGTQGAALGLLTVAIASGASICSHVNDSGFWLVGRLFGLTEAQTLRSWSVATTVIALAGFAAAALLSLLV